MGQYTYRLDSAGAVSDGEVTRRRDGVVVILPVEDSRLGAVRHEGVDDAGDGQDAAGRAARFVAAVALVLGTASGRRGGGGGGGEEEERRRPHHLPHHSCRTRRRDRQGEAGRIPRYPPRRSCHTHHQDRQGEGEEGPRDRWGQAGPRSVCIYIFARQPFLALVTLLDNNKTIFISVSIIFAPPKRLTSKQASRQASNKKDEMTYRLDSARAVGDRDIPGGQGGVRDLGVGEGGGLGAVRDEGVDDLGDDHARLEHRGLGGLLLLRLLGGGRGGRGGGPVDGGDCSGSREDWQDGLGVHLA